MNTAEKLEILKEASRNGNADATNDLAVCYLTGDGVEKNAEIALKLFEQAAEKDCAIAQNNLAILYRDGADECEPDPNKYLYYLDLAIQNGYSERTEEFVVKTIKLCADDQLEKPFLWMLKAEAYSFPYAEKNEEPFLYAFCLLRRIKMKKFLGMEDKRFFLDNPRDVAELWHEFYRNTCKIATSSDSSKAADAKKWIDEISRRIYEVGVDYLRDDQVEKAYACFDMVVDNVAEACLMMSIHNISKAVRNGNPKNEPVYKNYLQKLLRIVDQEEKIENFGLYANACHLMALMFREGYGTAVEINRSYEFESKAAYHGDEEAKGQLKFYKKKLLGGYVFKG